jgi:hypothetical protein
MPDKLDFKKYASRLDGKERARLMLRDLVSRKESGTGLLSQSEKDNLRKGMADDDQKGYDRLVHAFDLFPQLLMDYCQAAADADGLFFRMSKLHFLMTSSKGVAFAKGVLESDYFRRLQTEEEYAKRRAEVEARRSASPVVSDGVSSPDNTIDEDYSLVIRDGEDNFDLKLFNCELFLRGKVKASIDFVENLQVLEIIEKRPEQGDRIRFKPSVGEPLRAMVTEFYQVARQVVTLASLMDLFFGELSFNPLEKIGFEGMPKLVEAVNGAAEYHNSLVLALLPDEIAGLDFKRKHGQEREIVRELEDKDSYLVPELMIDPQLFCKWQKRLFGAEWGNS